MGATGVTMFVPKHVEHNFHAGVRIELVEFPSPRRSNLYALVDPGNPNRYGPENPLP